MPPYFKKIFTLDYRSLALLRIFVGLTLLFDIIQRSSSLLAHYTDAGVLPRALLFHLWPESAFLSVYFVNGSALYTGIMFIIAGIFALMMVFGWRTKLATIASFILLISLHNRNLLVLQGGDVALRVILFWMMFLPLSRRMSMDLIVGRERYAKQDEDYVGVPGVAYIVQFLLIWTFSGFLKDGAPWVTNLTAVAMALSLDTFTTNFGQWLRDLPQVLPYLTLGTLFLERYVFLLFLSPYKNGIFRIIGIFLLTTLVIGFNLSFRLGLFGMIMFSISLGLLPRFFWDRIILPASLYLSNKSSSGVTIFYDGDCSFCSRISIAIRKLLLLHPMTQISMASSDHDALDRMHSAHSWVVRDDQGLSYTGFRAFISLTSSSFVFRFLVPVFLFKPFYLLGEYFYRIVADNPHRVCIPPVISFVSKNKKMKIRTFKNVVLIGILLLVALWNWRTLPVNSGKYSSELVEKILFIPRLDQKWNMFAPYPTTEDGFYIIPGNLKDGSVVDVYSGSTFVSYEKPKDMAWMYKDQRWQKYMMNLWLKDFANYREGYAGYLCRQWNNNNIIEKQLDNFSIIYMLEETDLNTLKPKPLEPVVLWQHNCFL